MSEETQNQNTDEEIEDNRTFEEKFKSFIEKIRPYINQALV